MWICMRTLIPALSWQSGVYGDAEHGAMQTMYIYVAHAAMPMHPCKEGAVLTTSQAMLWSQSGACTAFFWHSLLAKST